MAFAKINGKWRRVRTLERDPYSSFVTVGIGKKKKTISRVNYKVRKSDRK